MMKFKSLLLTISLFLVACGDNDDNQNDYKYGVLKSDPPMPPLTYTWSHPDCPFTANFPGKPKEEVIEQEDGTRLITLSYLDSKTSFHVYCDINRLNPNFKSDDLEYYANSIFSSENTTIVNRKDSLFGNMPSIELQIMSGTLGNSKQNTNSIIFRHNYTLFSTSILKDIPINNSSGIEFFEGIRLK